MRPHHSFHRVQMFYRLCKFDLMALMKLFQEIRYILQYKRRLGMTYEKYNVDGKI